MTSYIRVSRDGVVSFVGPAATRVYHAMVLRSALKLLCRGIQPADGINLRNCLTSAYKLTGRPYPRSKKALLTAYEDVSDWIEKTRHDIPIIKDH
jgi:hypothetical protein